MTFRVLFGLAAVTCAACGPGTGSGSVTVDAKAPGHRVSPMLFGDQVETMDSDPIWDSSAHAARADVVEVLKRSGLRVLRYPGGTPSDFFHWDESIGPPESRKPQINPFTSSFDEEKRQLVDYGPDEAAALAKSLGTELLITANVGTGTAEEAAAWLKHYRAAGIRATYWEIGNEVWIGGDGYGAKVPSRTPEEYAGIFDAYAKALRAVDPEVKVLALGCHDTGAITLCRDADWNARVLANVKERIDLFAVHNSYAPAWGSPYFTYDNERVAKATLASVDYVAANFDVQQQDLDGAALDVNRSAPFAITEHAAFYVPLMDATTTAQMDRNRTLASALFSAAELNVFLSNPRIEMTQHLKAASNVWQAPVTTPFVAGQGKPVESAYFKVLRAYADAAEGTAIPVTVDSDVTFDSEQVGIVPKLAHVQALHASAVIPPAPTDGSTADALWIYVVNRDLGRDVRVHLEIAGVTVSSVVAETLNGDSYYAIDRTTAPDQVRWTTNDLGDATDVTFPAHSLTRLRIR